MKNKELISFIFSYYLIKCIEEAEPEESEEPFIAPPGLAIPPDVELVSIKCPAGLLMLIPDSACIQSAYTQQANVEWVDTADRNINMQSNTKSLLKTSFVKPFMCRCYVKVPSVTHSHIGHL